MGYDTVRRGSYETSVFPVKDKDLTRLKKGRCPGNLNEKGYGLDERCSE